MTQMQSDPRGSLLIDSQGEKLGSVEELYQDPGGAPVVWALVTTGVLGMGGKTLVPLHGAQAGANGGLIVPYTKQQVHDAPRVGGDGPLGGDEHRLLVRHYGLTGAPGPVGAGNVAPGRLGDENEGGSSTDQPGPDDGMAGHAYPAQATRQPEVGRASAVSAQPSGDPSPGAGAGQPPAARDVEASRVTAGDLADYGGQLAAFGEQLAQYGQRLAAYAQGLAEQQRGQGGIRP